MSTPKVLTVELEFEMGDRKIHGPRIKAAYDAAVAAAIEAAKKELLEGSISTVRHSMTWGYRWVQTGSVVDVDEATWDEVDADES
ncbi:hypothetical protein F4561_002695 [Lipingzhangella halophila]|uniref:Uncharacterized protein n=1 Tax=Lipingzhangella halophila TaxID=1783352 RepID=A0A7W7W3M5_9ACTN|nr:hypothetical protein [Lipingzhangella halophila]MBB4931875.1 hypothetical protein [Lipingzhangella halophila]